MTRAERWQGIGCVWVVFAIFALLWTYVVAPVTAELRAPAIRAKESRAADAREREYKENLRLAVRRGRPHQSYQLAPGQLTPWIETWRLAADRKSLTWDISMKIRLYVDWGEGKKVQAYDCAPGDDCLNSTQYPYRMRWENISKKPGFVSIWYF